jgi:hypothetical protein
MALSTFDEQVYGHQYLVQAWQEYLNTSKDPANGEWWTNSPTNDNMGLYGGLDDEQQPTNFDTDNQTYIPIQGTSQSVRTDNTNGLNPEVTAKLGYSYSQGNTTQHTVSDAISASVSEAVNVNFEVAGSTTTFKLTDTLTLTDSSTHSTVTTVDSEVDVPVQVPTGKIYETYLTYLQEELDVPFTMQVTITGNSETWFDDRVNGHYNWVQDIGDLTIVMGQNSIGESDGVSWSWGFSPVSEGVLNLSGIAKMYAGGAYTVKTIDVTPSTAATKAERDALVADAEIGVGLTLDDTGETHGGTIHDDRLQGGAGDDQLLLLGGSDTVNGGGGDDRIEALAGGWNLLHGEAGDDHITVVSQIRFNELHGDEGNDVLQANARSAILRGGAGDDRYTLGPDAWGSLIFDEEGSNQLAIASDAPLTYTRFRDDLHVHAGGQGLDPENDILWLGFFAGDNRVNGMTGEELLARPSGATPGDTVDWAALLDDVQATYDATGTWAALGYAGGEAETPETIDWNALAARVMANFAATGQWFV